jgi:hypothetical protein
MCNNEVTMKTLRTNASISIVPQGVTARGGMARYTTDTDP